MIEPKPGETYQLPSKAFIRVERKQQNDSYACQYVDQAGNLLKGRSLAPGVTLLGEFIGNRCQRVGP